MELSKWVFLRRNEVEGLLDRPAIEVRLLPSFCNDDGLFDTSKRRDFVGLVSYFSLYGFLYEDVEVLRVVSEDVMKGP